jgi:nicotinamidase/pyrazinamidase
MRRKETRNALLLVDVQNDFCPGGALAVPDGDAVVHVINRIVHRFSLVVATQDWHPPGHVSFASSHPGKRPGETAQVKRRRQVLWPDHCVQGSAGADFHPRLDTTRVRCVVRKGMQPGLDSYSTFLENDRETPTGLVGMLKELGVNRVFLAGLATDYCVRYSATDGVAAGFRVTVLEDACRGVDAPPGSLKRSLDEMRRQGVEILATGKAGL